MTEKKRGIAGQYHTGQKSLREFRMEQERGKLRFLERVQQEKEADEEIASYVPQEAEFPEREDDRTKE